MNETEIGRIKENIQALIGAGAGESDVDAYLKTESVTAEQLRGAPLPSSPAAELTHGAPVKSGLDIAKDSAAGGFVRGLRDIPDAGAQLVTRGLEAVAPAGSEFEAWARGQREGVEGINQTAEQEYRQDWRQGKPPGLDAGRIAGNVAATLPLTVGAVPAGLGGRLAAGVSAGGLAGSLQPVPDPKSAGDFWERKTAQTGIGAASGAAFPLAGAGLSRVIRPNTDPGVTKLLSEGVPMTPGQVLGGVARNVEDKLTSVPLIGWTIEAARKHGVEGFNRVAISRALQPIRGKLPKDLSHGREAIAEAHEQISKAYDDVLPRLSLKGDRRLVDELDSLLGLTKELPPDKASHFEKYLFDKVLSQVRGTGMDGKTVQVVVSGVKKRAADLNRSPDPWDRELGGAYKELHATLKSALERSGGKAARDYANANRAFAKLATIEDAAVKSGSVDGVFSPAVYSNAVRAADKSARKNKFAQGRAMDQDLSDPAKAHLPSTVGDSGTAGRSLWPVAAYSGALYDPASLGYLGAFMGAYSKPGQAAIEKMLSARPQSAPAIADAVRRGSARLGVGGLPVSEGLFGSSARDMFK